MTARRAATLEGRYRRALSEYVAKDGAEGPLIDALELGRSALAEGRSLLDLLSIHHAELPSFAGDAASDPGNRFSRAEEFLAQVVAPFEMTNRGWNEVVARLRRMNDTLERQVGERTEALALSEQRLERAQRIAKIGSWELDIASRDLVWSAEMYRICGVSGDRGQPTLADFVAHFQAEDRAELEDWLAHLQAGMARPRLELRLRRHGETRIAAIEGEPVIDEAGRIIRIAGTVQDVSERRQIEQQLVHAQKMEAVGSLTGGLAHDFNNLLGIIIGNLDLLNDQLPEGEPKELATDALEAALHGADLTLRLLAFARKQPLRPQRLNPNQLITDLSRLLGRTLGEAVQIELRLTPDLWSVLVDPAQLEATLTNLATNARDAMPGGGRLTIATRNGWVDDGAAGRYPDVIPGEHVLIEVADTGTGIRPEILARIFEPFFTTKEVGKGTGLGLSMVFGFVKQSGGHINVSSTPGQGTVFRLHLPRAEPGLDPASDAASRRTAPRGGETILVVEDNAAMRGIVVKQLQQLGYAVVEADTAADALEVLAAEPEIALLFTDVVMPGGMDGVALAREAVARWPRLRVLLTSGIPETYFRAGSAPGPHPRMLTKPYRRGELARAVRDALDSVAE